MGRTGLRVSEAVALRVQDLHLTTADGATPYITVRSLKKRKPRDDQVLLDQSTARAMSAYSKTVPLAPDGPLFPTGYPRTHACRAMTARNLQSLFSRYARRAGLPPTATPHSLRHYRGTVLYRATLDLDFVREQLRHRNITTTTIYLSRTREEDAELLEKCPP